ncbi:pilus assembly PilX N-terminal domain-containing protein [Pyxidicoccus trucidator]|uniref:pilus assembly PilX N-terminal domain-containing protein n=1 Tax=Pyxidicoccus trucidator TaxID=2709662 RepID=UPI0013DBDD0A|nr:hypothetical protein [Pyxidicoccus trucidator]
MNRPQPYMRPLVRPSAHRQSRLGGHRREERGIALIMAIALISFITAATLISLRAVSTESALQGHERRAREAFFAAQAGLAEGRDLVRQRLGTETVFNGVITGLGVAYQARTGSGTAHVVETGLPSDLNVPWFEVLPWTPYTLTTTPLGMAVDADVLGANREMNGPDGVRIPDFPDSSNVRYRVFLVDDEDGSPRTNDSNSRAWLVAVGEVTGPPGSLPHRSIVRLLITPATSGGEGPPCHELGCESNEG